MSTSLNPHLPALRSELENAAARLASSETGQEAARVLGVFLAGAGGRLDASNQVAVITMITGAFGPLPGTVAELLAAAAAGRVLPSNVSDAEL